MFSEVFFEIYKMFFEMAPYLMLGLAFAGVLHVLVSKEFIAKHLGKGRIMAPIKASLLGVPLPLCSCGVLPTALSFRKSKASKGAIVSFLVSTPETGVDSMIATYGMLGPVFGIFRPISAFLNGVVAGIFVNYFEADNDERESTFENDSCVIETNKKGLKAKIKAMYNYASKEFLDDISEHLILGIFISGLISFLVPDNFFSNYVTNDFLSMILIIIVGVPLYICATASIPVAVALMMKGLSPGAAFVFLTVGPATNAASIILISKELGRRTVLIYLTSIILWGIFSGTLLNIFFKYLNIDPINTLSVKHIHHVNDLSFYISLVFLYFLIASVYRNRKHQFKKMLKCIGIIKEGNAQMSEKLIIEGMTCMHCVRNVTNAIEGVSGVVGVNIDLSSKTAEIKGKYNIADVKKAVKDAGYSVN